MSQCPSCGDKTTRETEIEHHYSCWIKKKLTEQENLPDPAVSDFAPARLAQDDAEWIAAHPLTPTFVQPANLVTP